MGWVCLSPPGLYDAKSGGLFSADCFGALLSEPTVDAGDIESENLREGLITWAKVDSPWLQAIDSGKLNRTLDTFREMSPKVVLSCHLPTAYNMTTQFLRYLADVPAEDPFVGPDQQALKAMMGETSKE